MSENMKASTLVDENGNVVELVDAQARDDIEKLYDEVEKTSVKRNEVAGIVEGVLEGTENSVPHEYYISAEQKLAVIACWVKGIHEDDGGFRPASDTIVSANVFKFDTDAAFSVDSGYKYAFLFLDEDGNKAGETGWLTTPYTLPANQRVRAVARRINNSAVADVAEVYPFLKIECESLKSEVVTDFELQYYAGFYPAGLTSGNVDWSINYRVSSVLAMKFAFDVKITCRSGYGFAVATYDDAFSLSGESGWKSSGMSYTVSKNTYFRIIFKRNPEDTGSPIAIQDALPFAANAVTYEIETETPTGKTPCLAGRLAFDNNTCAIFRKVVCCGDSYTSGYIRCDNNSENYSNTNEQYAWPSFMERMTGNKYINCGESNTTVLSWQTGNRGLTKAQTAGVAQAYLVGLGLNDSNGNRVHLGTPDDIGTDAETYYGGLSKVIHRLNEISPKAKIFVMTMPTALDTSTQEDYNSAIRAVVLACKNTYPVHLLDLYQYRAMYQIDTVIADKTNNHYTAIGYQIFAENLRYIWSRYINEHIDEFKDVYLLPYDEK